MKTLVALIVCTRMALLPAWASLLQLAGVPNQGLTQDFNSYSPGVSVSTLPNWTVATGSFITEAGGFVSSNTAAVYSAAGYAPPGFTFASNHEVEVSIPASVIGSSNQGVAVAFQPDGKCYWLVADGSGYIYFGLLWTAGATGEIIFVSVGASIPTMKLRLSVTGTGTARRCTASYDIGAGWVIPPGWGSRDFGASQPLYYYDGGKAGIVGYGNTHGVKIDSLTIRNLP